MVQSLLLLEDWYLLIQGSWLLYQLFLNLIGDFIVNASHKVIPYIASSFTALLTLSSHAIGHGRITL
jgi:hypothetical protein